jgi:hypothetical protein
MTNAIGLLEIGVHTAGLKLIRKNFVSEEKECNFISVLFLCMWFKHLVEVLLTAFDNTYKRQDNCLYFQFVQQAYYLDSLKMDTAIAQ